MCATRRLNVDCGDAVQRWRILLDVKLLDFSIVRTRELRMGRRDAGREESREYFSVSLDLAVHCG